MHKLATEILECTQNPVPIEVLAYCNLQTPPATDLPREPRLYTLFCPYLRNYHHRMDAPGFPEAQQKLGRGWPANQPVNPVDDREYGRLFDEWLPRLHQAESGLGVFAYYQLAFVDNTEHSDRSRYLYHPDLELVAHEIRLFNRSGMGTFYDCSWPLPGLWPDARFAEVLIKLLWQPESDVAQLERAFYTDSLGDQATAVQAMLGRMNAALNLPGRPPLSPVLLDEAETTLGTVQGAAGTRYRAWIAYVRLAEPPH